MRAAPFIPTAVVFGLALESGGYFPHAWVWSAVVLAWLAAVVLILRDATLDRRAALFVAAAAALAAWTLLSATWSIAPEQSVLEARRALVYVAGALVVVVLPRRLVPVGVLAAIVAVTLVGVARYVVSGPVDPAQATLMSWPVGYANAFAALAAMALPVAIRAAPASVPLLVAVPVLTSSRGGVVAMLAGLGAFAVLGGGRPSLLRLLPAAAVAVGTCVVADPTGAADHLVLRRVSVAVGLAVATCLALPVRRSRDDARRGSRWTLALAGGCAITAAVVMTVLGTVDSQRAAYWRVGRQVVAEHPALGIGAGGYGRVWAERADVATRGGALDVHNVYLEMLAELGPVGLVLVVALLAIPLANARARPAVAAGYVAFLVHALLDWDWEMPAVTLAALLLGGSLLQPETGRALGERTRLVLALAAVALAAAALVGLRSPAMPGP